MRSPHDAVQIEGEPPLNVLINEGVAGDQATAAALVNTAPRSLTVSAGLLLMTDPPVPRVARCAGPIPRCRDAAANAGGRADGGGADAAISSSLDAPRATEPAGR